VLERLKRWAGELKAQVVTLWICCRHPDTPWSAKLLAGLVVAYAFSPIDLIPDFVPVLGYLDDLIIVPLGILIVVKLIPPEIIAEHRALAAAAQGRPVSHTAAIVIVVVWAASIVVAAWLCYRAFVS